MAFHFHPTLAGFGEHKWLVVGAIAFGGLVLFLYMRKNSDQADTTTTSYTADTGVPANVQQAEVESAAQLQLAQLSAAQQTSTQSYQLASDAQAQQVQLQIAQLQAATSTTQQVNALTGQQNLAGENLAAQETMAGLQEKLGEAQLTVGAAVQANNNATALSTATLANNTALQIANGTIAANVSLANINAQQTEFLAATTASVQQSMSENQTKVALGEQDVQKSIAQINSDTQLGLGKIQAGVQKTGSWLSTIGQIATTALMFA